MEGARPLEAKDGVRGYGIWYLECHKLLPVLFFMFMYSVILSPQRINQLVRCEYRKAYPQDVVVNPNSVT